jgi:dienelactone hydrolase
LRKVISIAAALAVVALGCTDNSTRGNAASHSTRPRVAPTTAAPVTTTTLGVLPPKAVDGLRVAPIATPFGVLAPAAPAARWLRVDRPDGRTQLVAVMRPRGHGRHPVVVYLHGSTGLSAAELAWAGLLTRDGFIVVAGCYLDLTPGPGPPAWVPCPGLANSNTASYVDLAVGYDALLDVASALPDAKPGAIGVFGVSLGGIVALTVPDSRVRAVVGDSGYGKAGAGVVHAPVLLLGMDADPRVDHARLVLFEAILRAAHKPVESHYYPGYAHVATLQFGLDGVVADATTRAETFLHHALG